MDITKIIILFVRCTTVVTIQIGDAYLVRAMAMEQDCGHRRDWGCGCGAGLRLYISRIKAPTNPILSYRGKAIPRQCVQAVFKYIKCT